jgi:transcriptional regulator with XRE-family HTH domain
MHKAPKNTVGRQLQKIRLERKLTQAKFATLCRQKGWNLTREIVARIEGGVRCVADFELMLLSEILKVPVIGLLPSPRQWKKQRRAFV